MKSIEVKSLNEIIQTEKNHILIDIRSADQHQKATIHGAVNIHPEEIESRIDEFKKYDCIYLHCNRGGASARACKKLEIAGLNNVVNVERGLIDWIDNDFKIDIKSL